jgi:hypothetical protein
MADEFKLQQQEVVPLLPVRVARRVSRAAQITKQYLPLERDPHISPEQRKVHFVALPSAARFRAHMRQGFYE